jgi:hypothetical protein
MYDSLHSIRPFQNGPEASQTESATRSRWNNLSVCTGEEFQGEVVAESVGVGIEPVEKFSCELVCVGAVHTSYDPLRSIVRKSYRNSSGRDEYHHPMVLARRI